MFQDSLSKVRGAGPVSVFALPLAYVRSTSGTEMKSLMTI